MHRCVPKSDGFSRTGRIRLLILLLLPVGLVHAQVPDTTQVAPDSLRVMPDTTGRGDGPLRPLLPPLDAGRAEPGTAVGDTILALSFERDLAGVLTAHPGAFLYDFGTIGWPNGWSVYGLNPNRVVLLFGGLPFDDPVTGRPRYDLLPFALLDAPRLQAARYGAPMAAATHLRPYTPLQPLTELHYRTSNTGLQSITALHTQQRPRTLFGQRGMLGILFGYGGHANGGEYPGSDLRRMRQVLGRIRYAQPGWSLTLTYLHNQRRMGAQGGVQPVPGLPFESVYSRLEATVRNPNARRQTIRNDLSLTVRTLLFPGLTAPLTVAAFTTAQTFRYRNPGSDTLEAKTNRYGVRLHQDVPFGPHRLRLLVEGWTDDVRRSNALPDTLDLSRAQLHASIHQKLRLGRFEATLAGGLHFTDEATFVGGSVEVAQQMGPLRLFAEGFHAGQPVSLIETYGFGRFVRPVAAVPDGRVSQARAGLTLRAGPFDLTVFGFAHVATKPLDLYTTAGEDSIEARVAGAAFRRAGAGGDLGWRRAARRGFYLTVKPTFVRLLHADASPDHDRMQHALPEFFAQGRFGARYAPFGGDLDLDVSLRGRTWTAMRGRTLHAPTGLLVLPRADDDLFPATGLLPASGILDVVLEAGIRTVTLFFAYENLLSGTQLLAGNLIVPVYPLPERRLRFGIFWPIEN